MIRFTTRKEFFCAHGASNTVHAVVADVPGGRRVELKERGRVRPFYFSRPEGAAAAAAALNDGKEPRLALSIGRRADQVAFNQAYGRAA